MDNWKPLWTLLWENFKPSWGLWPLFSKFTKYFIISWVTLTHLTQPQNKMLFFFFFLKDARYHIIAGSIVLPPPSKMTQYSGVWSLWSEFRGSRSQIFATSANRWTHITSLKDAHWESLSHKHDFLKKGSFQKYYNLKRWKASVWGRVGVSHN